MFIVLSTLCELYNLIYPSLFYAWTFIILDLITDVSQLRSYDTIHSFETGFSQKYARINASLGKCSAFYLSLTIKSPIGAQIHLLDPEGSSLSPYSLYHTSLLYTISRSLRKYAGWVTALTGLLIRSHIFQITYLPRIFHYTSHTVFTIIFSNSYHVHCCLQYTLLLDKDYNITNILQHSNILEKNLILICVKPLENMWIMFWIWTLLFRKLDYKCLYPVVVISCFFSF